jgi:hypothetical protein
MLGDEVHGTVSYKGLCEYDAEPSGCKTAEISCPAE